MPKNPAEASDGGPEPSTDTLAHEIKAASDIDDYLGKNRKYMPAHSLPEHLRLLLAQKGIRRADAARGSLLGRTYVYQIFSGRKTPSRDALIALAFGMRLSGDEAQQLLKLSGNQELYAKSERDSVILFALYRQMNILEANELLFSHGFAAIGVPRE